MEYADGTHVLDTIGAVGTIELQASLRLGRANPQRFDRYFLLMVPNGQIFEVMFKHIVTMATVDGVKDSRTNKLTKC